ncbi:MAG: methionyl-tRNA formyltransferase [Ezakiella sp.]|nr:methionyl-tRNA formyltransferase [Ezakiella sp.]MDD7471762.1 methionyl-tRNA formyltransferase [Bacillota bacterium]MDY3923514.1 methionyl-tRNA formyltransferase [Ezakiella sp.]
MRNSIVFFSSTEFGKEILSTLVDAEFEIKAVITRTDKVKNRGHKVEMTPVKKFALEKNIPVMEYDRLDEEATKKLEEIKPDFFLVVAYGALLSERVLAIPTIAPINIHTSILPKLRGASPIESAIRYGETVTGVSYMKMTKGLDEGDVYKCFKIAIDENEIFDTLEAKILKKSKETIVDVINQITLGLEPKPQVGKFTYAKKILKSDTLIDFNKPSSEVKNLINSLSTHIGAYALLGNYRYKFFSAKLTDKKLPVGKIETKDGRLFIGTADGAIEVFELQAQGKKRLKVEEFLRGKKIEGVLNE